MSRSASATRNIKLVSSDGRPFIVPMPILRMSSTLCTMLEEVDKAGNKDTESNPRIPLPDVEGEILDHIITWCTKHKNDPTPLEVDEDPDFETDDIDFWDEDFLITIREGTFIKLVNAADYLDLKGLMVLTCKIMAKRINAENIDEVERILTHSITNDFNREDLEHIQKENEWCKDKSQEIVIDTDPD